MRYSSILTMFFLLPAVISADPVFSIRPLDRTAATVIIDARKCSAVIRGLLQELEGSNLIVHVEVDWSLPHGLGGATNFVATRGGYRYVRVRIASWLSMRQRVATLGHELQHAIEIARSDATDHRGVRRLLDESGYTLGGRYYETESARKVEHRIRMER